MAVIFKGAWVLDWNSRTTEVSIAFVEHHEGRLQAVQDHICVIYVVFSNVIIVVIIMCFSKCALMWMLEHDITSIHT